MDTILGDEEYKMHCEKMQTPNEKLNDLIQLEKLVEELS